MVIFVALSKCCELRKSYLLVFMSLEIDFLAGDFSVFLVHELNFSIVVWRCREVENQQLIKSVNTIQNRRITRRFVLHFRCIGHTYGVNASPTKNIISNERTAA